MKIGNREITLNQILIGVIIIMTFFLMKECSSNENLRAEAEKERQNRIAASDSVRIIKNKWNEEISIKNTLIADKKELSTLNKKLSDDLKKLEGQVLYISSTVAEIKSKQPIIITNTIKEYPNGIRELSWNHEENFDEFNCRALSGNSQFIIDTIESNFQIIDKGTTITKNEMRMKILTGITEMDDSYQIFVKTDFPGVTFPSIDGAVLDKKMFRKTEESSLIFGPSIYFGIGIDPLNRTAGPQIGAGISVTYNLNKFVKKIFNR